MANCTFSKCKNTPVGGFQKLVEAPTVDEPTAILTGTRICWCRVHQEALIGTTYGQFGRRLRADELV